MNPLAHKLGLDKSLQLYDVLSLTDTDLLALVPRPCHALLFVFPVTATSEAHWPAEDADRPFYPHAGPEEPVLWFAQTIGHACGLIGLLHCICNVDKPGAVVPHSNLAQLIDAMTPLHLEQRAALLYDSNLLEAAHAEAAVRGSSHVPSPSEDPGCGYVAFVRGKDGHLWELEGRRKGPLDRGAMRDDEDLLSESVIARGPGEFLKREKMAGGDCRFSCLALGPADQA